MSEIKINNIPVITENNGSVELTTDTANIGNNALVVNSSGNVGINKANPTIRLDVEGNENILGWFKNNTENGNSRIICQNPNFAVNIGLTGTDGSFNVYHGSTNKSSIMCYPDGHVKMLYQPAFEARTYDNGTNSGYYPSAGQVEVVTPYVNVTNIGNHFDLQNNRFTAPISGMYVIGFNFYFTPASGNYIGGVINISTGRYLYAFSSPGADANATYSTCIYLNQNDWVKFLTYCQDGSSRLFNSSTVYGYFLG